MRKIDGFSGRAKPRRALCLTLGDRNRGISEPMSEIYFRELAGGHLLDNYDGLRLGRVQTEPVYFQKYRSDGKGYALVAIDERMVPCQAIAIRSGEIENGRLWLATEALSRSG